MATKAPRAWIEVTPEDETNAAAVDWKDIIELSVENTLYNAADNFELTLRNDRMISEYLRKKMEIKIWLGYVANPNSWKKEELQLIFSGIIDGVRVLFANQQTVKLVGRDYSAALIDHEFSIAYAERTASQIAELLAESNGLGKKITTTTAIIEKDLYKDKRQWEVLQALADREGFVCYVNKNKELYFGPRQNESKTAVATFRYRDSKNPELSNVSAIEFDDSLLEIINRVIVRHWQGQNKQLIEAEAKNEDLIKKYKEYKRVIYSAKALTPELAKIEAEARLKELCRAVVTGEQLRVAGNPDLEAEAIVEILNVGRFSGSYYVDRITHRYSMSNGYICELNVTSQQPDSAAQYRNEMYDDTNEQT